MSKFLNHTSELAWIQKRSACSATSFEVLIFPEIVLLFFFCMFGFCVSINLWRINDLYKYNHTNLGNNVGHKTPKNFMRGQGNELFEF